MDSREQKHNISGGDAEPSALPEDLKKALDEAYPDPAGRIAASVMAQIRAEREAEEKRIRAEKADARRRRQGIFMKWGGMAACVGILCGALVIASPLMNRGTDMAAQNGVPEEQAVLTADDSAGMGMADAQVDAVYGAEEYSDTLADVSTFTYQAEEEVVAETPMTKSAPVKRSVETEAEPAENGMIMMYSMAKTAAVDAAAEEVLADACYDPAAENEALLQELIDCGYLTEGQYLAWMEEKGYTDAGEWDEDELCAAFGVEN